MVIVKELFTDSLMNLFNGEWKFKAIGEFGMDGGSSGISHMRERCKQLI